MGGRPSLLRYKLEAYSPEYIEKVITLSFINVTTAIHKIIFKNYVSKMMGVKLPNIPPYLGGGTSAYT